MDQPVGDKRIDNLFTKGSDHRNLPVVYIVQNTSHQAKESRNINGLNARYIVLFVSPRDYLQEGVIYSYFLGLQLDLFVSHKKETHYHAEAKFHGSHPSENIFDTTLSFSQQRKHTHP